MKNLVYLDLGISIPDEAIGKIKQNPIDLADLNHLKLIAVSPDKDIGVPPFINVRNKPAMIRQQSDKDAQRKRFEP